MPSNESQQPMPKSEYYPEVHHGIPAWSVPEILNFIQAIPPILRTGMLNFRSPLQAYRLAEAMVRWRFSTAAQLRRAVARDPHRIAIIDDEGEMTWRRLDEEVTSLAKNLRAEGAGPGTRVAIMARNGRGMVIPLAAKGFIGVDVLLLNVGSSEAQLDRILTEHRVDHLFIDDEFVDRIPEGHDGVKVTVTHIEDPANPPAMKPEWTTLQKRVQTGGNVTLDKIAHLGRIIIMSSGTTGTPKGVIYGEPKTPKVAAGILQRVPWRPHLVVQQTASMFHAWGWGNINLAFAARATLVLRRVFDPVKCMEDAERHGVNAYVSSVVFLKEMLEAEEATRPYNLKKPRFIVSSGNAMPAWLVRKLNKRFGPVTSNFYGSTEIGQVAMASAEMLDADPETAGPAMPGVRLSIRDEEGREVPQGTVGRIFSANGMMFKGYSNPEIPIDIEDNQVAIGDLGYLDERGFLYVCGRADDMIINGGENIFPREAEEALGTLPGVKDVFVRGDKTDPIKSRLVAYVVREDSEAGRNLTEEMVKQHVVDELIEQAEPRDVFWMEDLPRNDTGKVLKRELPDVKAAEGR
ncbi:AMP-binding protein [Corynebacterium sphenisci]|uniref:AMP-binding protein n=1 Tax=Corynebacterium sphenisci TaxID=191493 RepID=UPI0012F51595|nr:AMP-binding protein [Corynebacterium sphenisci]